MKKIKIDLDSWKRKPYYEHYMNENPCTYSMVIKLDITKIIESKEKLYPALLYSITKVINNHEEFRYALNEKKELIMYDYMMPCYTVFHKEEETFSNIWTEWKEDYTDFLNEYNNDLLLYKDNIEIMAKQNTPENTFPVSMIPWTSFESFNLNIKGNYEYLTPIFTIGKYYREENKTLIPLAIQVHHGVCDGFHTCRFCNELQEVINKIK